MIKIRFNPGNDHYIKIYTNDGKRLCDTYFMLFRFGCEVLYINGIKQANPLEFITLKWNEN